MKTLTELLNDEEFTGKLFIALQKAINEKFTETDWDELGYQTGHHEDIRSHSRLLRSLRWGDDDYGSCIFQILKLFSTSDHNALQTIINHKKVQEYLIRNESEIISELSLNTNHVPTILPKSLSASEVVERALFDADQLLHSNGAISCIDRLHTALHGYLRYLCSTQAIQISDTASITAIFKLIRLYHPSFQSLGTQDNEMIKILNGFGSVVDAINTIRNNASVAHPNESLLAEEEAILVLNTTRTIFHYLSSKI